MAASETAFRAWALRRFAAASVALERSWLPKFDAILATSTSDREIARRLAPGANVVAYPNALPEIPLPRRLEQQAIAFSGNLEYPPNISAVRFFRDNIWPILEARWPELKWKIVGKNPDAIRPLVAGQPRIEVTGFVKDAVAVLAECQIAVIPLLAGSGTRVKILEAWAAGTPVVSTTLGAEGLDCAHETNLLLADEPQSFASAVSRLLTRPKIDCESDRRAAGSLKSDIRGRRRGDLWILFSKRQLLWPWKQSPVEQASNRRNRDESGKGKHSILEKANALFGRRSRDRPASYRERNIRSQSTALFRQPWITKPISLPIFAARSVQADVPDRFFKHQWP